MARSAVLFIVLGSILGTSTGVLTLLVGMSLQTALMLYILAVTVLSLLLPRTLLTAQRRVIAITKHWSARHSPLSVVKKNSFQPVESLVESLFDRSQAAFDDRKAAGDRPKEHRVALIVGRNPEDLRKFREWAWEVGTDSIISHDPIDALSLIDGHPGYFRIIVVDAVSLDEQVALLFCIALGMRDPDIRVVCVQEFPRALTHQSSAHHMLRFNPVLISAGKTAFKMAMLALGDSPRDFQPPGKTVRPGEALRTHTVSSV